MPTYRYNHPPGVGLNPDGSEPFGCTPADPENFNPQTDWYVGMFSEHPGHPPLPVVSPEEWERRGNEWAARRGGWEVQNRNAREVVRQQNESKKKGD